MELPEGQLITERIRARDIKQKELEMQMRTRECKIIEDRRIFNDVPVQINDEEVFVVAEKICTESIIEIARESNIGRIFDI
jgi:hypothetical protein